MERKTALGILSTLLLIGMLTLTSNVQPTQADQKPQLSLETDKDVYFLGENVTIILVNIGTETVNIGGYPAWHIFTYPREKPVYPMVYAFLAWSLKPGENDTFTWNQFNQYTQRFAEPGTYVVKDTQGWGLTAYFTIAEVEEQWIRYIPDPDEVDLAFWMVGEIAYVEVTIQFSNPCFIIRDWGTVTKSGYNLWVDTKIWRWTGACILIIPPPVSHTYELGPLESGTYKFTFQAWEVPVESIVFTIPPSPGIHITGIKPPQGPPGTEVCIFGGGATPEGAVVALFSGPLLENPDIKPLLNITVGQTVADEEEYWNIHFILPSFSTGKYAVYVVDNTTQTSASTTFDVTPVIMIPFQINYVSPQAGTVGTSVSLSGSGATPDGEVRVYFDETNVANATAKDGDWWSVSFEVPDVEPGDYTITALDVMSDTTDTASFTVTAPPTIRVFPSEAPIGSKITISGEGFTPRSLVFISFEDTLLFAFITIDENGEFNVTVFVPMVNSGNYMIKALTLYPSPEALATVNFTVTKGLDDLLADTENAQQSVNSTQDVTDTATNEDTLSKEAADDATGEDANGIAIAVEAKIYALLAVAFALTAAILSGISLKKRK